ncbi:hypothetical protein CYMTET_55763 [Cymbomonas tetramitiformis]|uniref:KIF-binding protein n=1 Tax=Cymbomonas tetramitiformis TaxID=36881 RepID=A0AAE0BCA1_9CHLO|nr:hypothetical protein CYMTET_55763 [Cymbomonas tetramitiformis]
MEAQSSHVVMEAQSLHVMMDELDLPAPVPETGLLVDTFADALKLFNLAMPHFREAAKYYILDGFVTEHINILMDVSGLYKHLAHFDPDTHRQCVMHRKRTKPLEPLQKTLNPKAFDGQWKGIHFELGETFRTIMEIKKDTGRPHLKALEAGSKALYNYNVFLAAVEEGARIAAGKTEGAEESKELIRVDKDEENMYLSARFCRARVFQKLQPETEGGGPPDTTNLKLALDEFEALLAYAKKFQVQTFKDELDICQQMAELLPTKLNNMHRQ